MWSADWMAGWLHSAGFAMFAVTALKSLALAAAAWVVAALAGRRSAAARHQVWTAAFAALLALPLLEVSLPPLHVRHSLPLADVVFRATAAAPVETAEARELAVAGAAARSVATPARRIDLRIGLMLLWAAGALVALAQMLAAALLLWRMRRRASRFADADAAALAHALGIRQPVDLLAAPKGSMPMAFGLFRPAIFLPADAADWSAERRHVVLLHELAHIRRGDTATHLLARTALSLYWWNPLAWIAWRAFLKERERAADDLVLGSGARASEYAGHLLDVARQMQSSPAIGWAAICMARRSQLEGRLLAILDERVNHRAPGRVAAVVAALLAIAIVAPLAAVQSQDPAQQALSADVDATIRSATAQKNHEILESAAKAAETLRKFDLAQKLMESAVAIRAQASGERSTEYGVGLVKLGDVEAAANHLPEATATYLKAVDVLGNQPEAAPAYLHLGVGSVIKKDYEGAVSYFQQMQIADPSKAGTALMWMALARQRQGQPDESDSLFRATLAAQDEKSPEAATTRELYANLLDQTNRKDEAAQMRASAAEIRRSARPALVRTADNNSGVYRVSASVSAPTLLSKTEPEYSEEARAAKYQGTVVVYVEIGPDGVAHNAQITRSLGMGLDQKALDAISQWRFKPGTKDGVPVTVSASIEVNFRLL